MKNLTLLVLTMTGLIFGAGNIRAAEPTKAQLDFFESKVRPVLVNHCYKCHSEQSEKVKGELLLDSRDAVLKGGKTGPAIVPGNVEKSLLIKAVRYIDEDLQMPPKGEKLSEAQIADLVAWVKMGAPDPRVSKTAGKYASNANGKAHWAFQPVRKPALPEVKAADWVASPVDAFILAKLEANDMKPSPAADKRALIRRATYDLIGLPPTPEEVKAFLDDNSKEAFAKVVDRLLASPRYGERWGRFWLDTARYSDTKGEFDKKKETPFYPFAWTYRDYVIRAFNDDKPYDRFIQEQLSADKLTSGKDKSALAAMGFLTLGDHFKGNANDIINDRIDVVTKGMLGLTVTCARCHDHKFDPIPTQDYYSLHGIFASSHEPKYGPILNDPLKNADYGNYRKQLAALDAELAALNPRKAKGPAAKELRKQRAELMVKMDVLDMTHPGSPARAMVLEDDAKPEDSRVFLRGEAENKGDVAPRRFLEVLSGSARPLFKIGSGRLELARAIANKNNPLTARVMVNRIWLHHFGEGFVTTPDDFGTQSAPPSHPELLDYLASRFMEDGWSIKKMHRLIMLSNVYQQGSGNNPRYAQVDPYNRLLWRANVRRLEFEPLRDSLLALGGKLDLTMEGKPVKLANGNGGRRKLFGGGKGPNAASGDYSTRRTVYGYIDRSDLPEVFNHFDFANPDMTTGRRYETTVPQQSLFMMNSPLVIEQARNLVERDDVQSEPTDEARIQKLYDLIYQREARADEIKLGLTFLEESAGGNPVVETTAATPARPFAKLKANQRPNRNNLNTPGLGPRRKPLSAWAEYAHALLLANEATFVN